MLECCNLAATVALNTVIISWSMLICVRWVPARSVSQCSLWPRSQKVCPTGSYSSRMRATLLTTGRREAEMEMQLSPRPPRHPPSSPPSPPFHSRPRQDSAWSDKASVAASLHLTGPVWQQQQQQQLSIMVEHIQISVSAHVFRQDTKQRRGRAS